MESNKPRTILSIQYLRAIAALMVVFYHARTQIEEYTGFLSLFKSGAAGVDVFFVISGFVIWMVTTSNPTPMDFMARRIIRVAPIYWLITLAIIVGTLVAPSLFRSTHFGPPEVLKSLLFIPHYHTGIPEQIWPILIPGWTLNYEMFFYACFALTLTLKISNTTRFQLFLGTYTSLIAIGFLTTSSSATFIFLTNNIILEFLYGMAIAHFYFNNKIKPSQLLGGINIIIGILLLGLLPTLIKTDTSNLRAFFWGIPGALFVYGLLQIEQCQNVIKSKFLHILGDASYSIYLTHPLTLGLFRNLWLTYVETAPSLLQATLFIFGTFISTTIIGILFYYLIELRITKILNSRYKKTFYPQATSSNS